MQQLNKFKRFYRAEFKYNPISPDVYAVHSRFSRWNYLYFLMPLTSFALGVWQIQRKEWKDNLIKERERGLKADPMEIDWSQELDPAQLPTELSWRPISVTGKWMHHLEVLVGPRVHNGKGGYHLITPLETSQGSRLLVNRGFVPKEKRTRPSRPETTPNGIVTVNGTLRQIVPKPAWVPQNEPEKGLWYWIDIPALAFETHSKQFLLEQLLDTEHPTTIPIGGHHHQPLKNKHFQYIITFFGLGFFTTGMSFLMLRRGRVPTSRFFLSAKK